MSNRGRAGLIVLAVAVVAVAFIVLRPSDDNDKADKAADTTATAPADDTGKQPTATAESAPPPPQEVTLKNGAPQGGIKRIEVKKGDEVRIQVRTDETTPDEIHLHGYDIEKETKSGSPANFKFKADIDGIFEIESHTAEDAGKEPLIARLVVEPS